ncbi:MAG: chorismate synthase, partial [Blautia sp.]
RETIGRAVYGAIACRILEALGIHLTTYTKAIGPFSIPSDAYDYSAINENRLYMPNQKYAEQASAYLESCIREQDSSGGLIECMIHGMPSGIGEPVFNKLDAALAKAVMSIGAVKGVEIGDGFSVVSSKGSKNNDSFFAENGQISKLTNHSGGILGGLSDGSPILLRAAIKPTPSISQPQKTVNTNGENIEIEISGRHDPVIVPRAVVVVESMAAVTLVDLLMQNMSSRIEYMKQVYLGI